MTYNPVDHEIFKGLIAEKIEDIEKAGIFPTSQQLEGLARCLPHASFIQLLDMFSSLVKVHDDYFLCSEDDIRKWAELLKNLPFSIHDFYTFCTIPVRATKENVSSDLVKIAKKHCSKEKIDKVFVQSLVKKRVMLAKTFTELGKLNDAYEVVRACVWLSSRFPGTFVDVKNIREYEHQIEELINQSMKYAIYKAK